jgi:hypothetical protein
MTIPVASSNFPDGQAHPGAEIRRLPRSRALVSRPWVTDLLARRAQRSHFLRDALSGILNETIDPRTVFSLGACSMVVS